MYDSIIILGATATGKTNLAIKLATKLKTEIVNADSMYIYKYFNIGTAKPTHDELAKVKHHLVDFLEPSINYSVAKYREDASNVISNLFAQKKIPIVVGGTGFYIDSLIKPYTYGNTETNLKLREKLENDLSSFGKEYLYDMLKKLDPESASKIHLNDTKRVIRAIEISTLAGNNKSKIINNYNPILKNPLIIGLNMERDILYERINSRVDIMIKDGLLDEVKTLYQMGFTEENCNAMKGIGYKEILGYLNGEFDLDFAIEKIKQHTRNYAKRQITWFRRNENILWFNPNEANLIEKILDIFKK